MALFSYEALTKEGKKIRGVVDASSASAVREQLTKQGLYPIRVATGIQDSQGGFLATIPQFFTGGIPIKQRIVLTRQLAVLLRSGVPLLQALELLTDQFKGAARTLLVRVKDDVKEGVPLADALSRYPRVFDAVYIQLVRAGEASGKLEEILERLASNLERQMEVSGKIRGALQMPAIQAVVALGVVGLLMTTAVPRVVNVLSEQGIELPVTTRFLMSISNFVMSFYAVIGLAIVVMLIAAFIYWKRTDAGGRMYDKILLRIPLVGHLARTRAVVQFSYTLGLLLQGGVNLAQALDIVCDIVDNKVLAHSLRQARENIVKQGKVAEYLKQTGIFPPIAIYLFQTGEQTGQLDTMLLLVAKNYSEDLDELIDRLTSLINPLVLVLMAVVIGFIIMSIVGPMMQGGQQLAG